MERVSSSILLKSVSRKESAACSESNRNPIQGKATHGRVIREIENELHCRNEHFARRTDSRLQDMMSQDWNARSTDGNRQPGWQVDQAWKLRLFRWKIKLRRRVTAD